MHYCNEQSPFCALLNEFSFKLDSSAKCHFQLGLKLSLLNILHLQYEKKFSVVLLVPLPSQSHFCFSLVSNTSAVSGR